MAGFDDDVKILVGVEPDTGSAKDAASTLSDAISKELNKPRTKKQLQQKIYDANKAEKAKTSKTSELLKEEEKRQEEIVALEKRKLALKGNNTKDAKSERAELDKQLDILRKQNQESAFKRLDLKESIEYYRTLRQEIQDMLAAQKGEGSANVFIRTDEQMEAYAEIQKTAESARRAVDETASYIDSKIQGTGSNIKKTASQIKLETQKIIETFSQQPSKDFTKEENNRIKLLQQNLAEAKRKSDELRDKLDEPWKLKVEARDAERQMEELKHQISEQEQEVQKLDAAYADAHARAVELANTPLGENLSADERRLATEQVRSAIRDSEALGRTYDAAKAKLDELKDSQDKLAHTIVETKNRYKEMMDELKKDTHNDAKVSAGDAAYEEYDKAVDAVEQLEMELDEVYSKAKENDLIKKEDLEVAKQIEETLKGIGNEVRNIQTTGNLFGEKSSTEEAVNNNKELIAQYNKEIGALKQSAAQYYYKLRAVKMLGFAVNNITGVIVKFGKTSVSVATTALKSYLKLIPGVSKLQKALSKTNSSQKQFAKETKKVNSSSKQFNFTLKDLIKNILKYGLGIRSVYVLFNKLRQAMMFGFENMAKQFESVNKPLSSLLTSFTMMKNAVATAVQPLVNVLAPILEKLSALFSEVTYKIASFIAALTGKSTVFKAIRVQQDYAASLDKTAKSANKAKQELSGLDKLNVLTTDKSGDDDSGANMFEEVPIDSTMADWAKKFKEFLDRLLAPIKAAWEKMKNFVLNAWNTMCNKLKDLWSTVVETFWRVWEEYDTQKIFENIFKIVGDIFLIVANIADALKVAWEHNDNGYRIFKAIRDILLIITDALREAADYTVEWSKHLSFIPLFDALANALEQQIVPAVKKVMDLLVIIYEQIILKIVQDFIEKGLPQIVSLLGKIGEIIGIIAEKLRIGLQSGSNGIIILHRFEDLLQIIMDGLQDCADRTKEWAENLDFRPLFVAIKNFLEQIKPAVQFVVDTVKKFWNDVLLPFWKYLIEDGGPRLLDLLGKIFGEYDESTGLGIDWEHLTNVMNEFMDALEPFLELAWETLLQIIEDLGKAFDDLVNSGTLDTIVEKFKDWVSNAKPDELAGKIEGFAVALGKMYAQFLLLSKIILPLVTTFMTFKNFFVQGSMVKNVATLTDAVNKLSGAGGAEGLSGLFGVLKGIPGQIQTLGYVIPDFISVMGPTIASIAVPIAIAVGAIALLVASFGGLDETLAAIKERIDSVIQYFKGFAEAIGLADTFDKIKEKFGELKESLSGIFDTISQAAKVLRPLFEGMFDVIADVAKFLGGEVMAILDGLGTSLGGVIDFLTGFFDIIGGIAKILTGDFDAGMKLIEEGFGKELQGILEVVNGLFTFLLDSLANLIDVLFPGLSDIVDSTLKGIKGAIDDWIKSTGEGLSKWIEDVLNFFINLKKQLIGDPIVYDMRDGIISGFGDFVSETAEDVSGWVKDIIGDFGDMAKGVGENLGKAKDFVFEKFGTIASTVKEKGQEFLTNAKEKFEGVKERAEENLSQSKFSKIGETVINGLKVGMVFPTLVSAVVKGDADIVKAFRNGLKPENFKSIMSNCMSALSGAISSALPSLLSTASNVGNSLISRFKSTFKISSPSKIFTWMGDMIDAGLEKGVEDGANDVGDAFEDLLPTTRMLDSFYDKFMEMISALTLNVTDMFDEMFLHIQESMLSLENMMSMSDIYNKLDKLPDMKLPSIVNGQTLPSNKEFRQSSTELDLSKLPDIIKNAVIEAITDTADLQTDDGDTIIEIDGREIFRVVRNENSQYKKQHGASAFA